jgi:hypothetical protein
MSQLRVIVAAYEIYSIVCGKPLSIGIVNLYVADKDIAQKIVSIVGAVISWNLMLNWVYYNVTRIAAHCCYILWCEIETTALATYPYIMALILSNGKDILLFQNGGAISIGE